MRLQLLVVVAVLGLCVMSDSARSALLDVAIQGDDQQQKADGQQNQKDDGQRNQKDDGDKNQKDDGQANRNDGDAEEQPLKNARPKGKQADRARTLPNTELNAPPSKPVKDRKSAKRGPVTVNAGQNQKDDGQKNQKDDGQKNQKDDGQRNQKNDGQNDPIG